MTKTLQVRGCRIEVDGDRLSGSLEVSYKEISKDGSEYSDGNRFLDHARKENRSVKVAAEALARVLEGHARSWAAICRQADHCAEFGAWDDQGNHY